VFTARYALSPYIKQILFVFKRLIRHMLLHVLYSHRLYGQLPQQKLKKVKTNVASIVLVCYTAKANDTALPRHRNQGYHHLPSSVCEAKRQSLTRHKTLCDELGSRLAMKVFLTVSKNRAEHRCAILLHDTLCVVFFFFWVGDSYKAIFVEQ
jgi:hypothetical protein